MESVTPATTTIIPRRTKVIAIALVAFTTLQFLIALLVVIRIGVSAGGFKFGRDFLPIIAMVVIDIFLGYHLLKGNHWVIKWLKRRLWLGTALFTLALLSPTIATWGTVNYVLHILLNIYILVDLSIRSEKISRILQYALLPPIFIPVIIILGSKLLVGQQPATDLIRQVDILTIRLNGHTAELMSGFDSAITIDAPAVAVAHLTRLEPVIVSREETIDSLLAIYDTLASMMENKEGPPAKQLAAMIYTLSINREWQRRQDQKVREYRGALQGQLQATTRKENEEAERSLAKITKEYKEIDSAFSIMNTEAKREQKSMQ